MHCIFTTLNDIITTLSISPVPVVCSVLNIQNNIYSIRFDTESGIDIQRSMDIIDESLCVGRDEMFHVRVMSARWNVPQGAWEGALGRSLGEGLQ